MSLHVGYLGANYELRQSYLGQSGINRLNKEAYIGSDGVNRKVSAGLFYASYITYMMKYVNIPNINTIDFDIMCLNMDDINAMTVMFSEIASTQQYMIINLTKTEGGSNIVSIYGSGASSYSYTPNYTPGQKIHIKIIFYSTYLEILVDGVKCNSILYSELGCTKFTLGRIHIFGNSTGAGNVSNLIIK